MRGLLLAVIMGSAQAAPAPAPVRAEIDALLAELPKGQCQFFRNGSWHDAAQAREHLLRKLAYLEDHGGLKSTAQFIAQAATRSSRSGQAYRVKCADSPELDSGRWLSARLTALRKAK